jgi:hypothetical protein
MSRDDDVVGEKYEAPVPLMVRGVPEEKAVSGSTRKFVGSGGGGVRIADTAKNTKVRIGRGNAEEGEERSRMIDRLVGGGSEGRWQCGGPRSSNKQKGRPETEGCK